MISPPPGRSATATDRVLGLSSRAGLHLVVTSDQVKVLRDNGALVSTLTSKYQLTAAMWTCTPLCYLAVSIQGNTCESVNLRRATNHIFRIKPSLKIIAPAQTRPLIAILHRVNRVDSLCVLSDNSGQQLNRLQLKRFDGSYVCWSSLEIEVVALDVKQSKLVVADPCYGIKALVQIDIAQILSLSYSQDDKLFAVVGDKTLIVFNRLLHAQIGRIQLGLKGRVPVYYQFLSEGGQFQLRQKESINLQPKGTGPQRTEFSSDSEYLAASMQPYPSHVWIISTRSCQLIAVVQLLDKVHLLGWTNQGVLAVRSDSGRILVWRGGLCYMIEVEEFLEEGARLGDIPISRQQRDNSRAMQPAADRVII